ncbi:MAG: hypothetical protein ACLFSE_02670 [Spirochaetia bacterium]
MKKTIPCLLLFVISHTGVSGLNINIGNSFSSAVKVHFSEYNDNPLLSQTGSSLSVRNLLGFTDWFYIRGGITVFAFKPSITFGALNYSGFSGLAAETGAEFSFGGRQLKMSRFKFTGAIWGSYSFAQYSSASLLFSYPGIGISAGITLYFTNSLPFKFGFSLPFELYFRRDLSTAISAGAEMTIQLVW